MQHNIEDLCKYRLEQARNALAAAAHNLEFDLKTSLNRSYYSILYTTKALLAADGKDAHSHRGLFVLFNKEYIKTKIFKKELSSILKEASMIRDKSDYADFYIVSMDEAKEQIENAERFLNEISNYLDSKYKFTLKSGDK